MDAAKHYLAGATKDFSSAEQTELAQQVAGILDAPDFAELFAPGSRAEVAIVGRIARPDGRVERVPGQVDRLAVTGDAVLIGDYKTDRLVPQRARRGAGGVYCSARALPHGAGAALSR